MQVKVSVTDIKEASDDHAWREGKSSQSGLHEMSGGRLIRSRLLWCERKKHFNQNHVWKRLVEFELPLMSSDLYNDRQVWLINELSAMTLRSIRRLETTTGLVEKVTPPYQRNILQLWILK